MRCQAYRAVYTTDGNIRTRLCECQAVTGSLYCQEHLTFFRAIEQRLHQPFKAEERDEPMTASKYHTVEVCFQHDLRPEKGYNHNPLKQYKYITDDITITKGDIVIVDSPDTRYTCVAVVDIHHYEVPASGKPKWVVAKLDISAHEARMEKLRKTEELQNRLQKAAEEHRKRINFEEMAKANPEIATLLAELKDIEKDT